MFCKLLDKDLLKTDFSSVKSEEILQKPLTNKNDLTTLIRKAFANNINLRELFKKEDKFKQGLIERLSLYQILENLPLGYSPEDIYEIFRDSTIFDAHGNADYTIILQNEIYCILEKLKFERETRQSEHNSFSSPKKSLIESTTSDARYESVSDSRKVIVEDVIFLYDFDIVIYTTVFPKSSNIYISHTVPLHGTNSKHGSLLSKPKSNENENAIEEMSEEVLKYKFLATLKGHKNMSPPTIKYIEETGCLLSGEKEEKETQLFAAQSGQENKLYEPNVHPSVNVENLGEEKQYINHAYRMQNAPIREVLVWNLQKDLIHMMQANPPWIINQPTYRFNAHNGSIIDIAYLPSAQLIATASTDQTIRFFDPIAAPYLLTEPRKFGLISTKPGHYDSINDETTNTNSTFNEIRRIYTAPMTPHKLQALNLINTGGAVGEKNRDIKSSSIEWVIALKLSPTSVAGSGKQHQGVISGYGIERIKLMVPASRHDDMVPETVHKECEEEAQEKRKKSVIAFHSVLPYNLEHLLANVTLQTSQTNKLSELFKEAMLNRTTGKYMLSKPLKEVFQILLEIPERKKYGHIIKEKGRGMVLSVSEVYFYLKKYFQIHPTNLNQVMFAKLVKIFKENQNKSLIAGIRKWPTDELNVLADHIRKFGITKDLSECESSKKEFFTHSEFIEFLKTLKLNLNENQLKSIANDIDTMGAQRITYQQIQQMFIEEIKQYNIAMFKRPNPITEEIRSMMIPYKKLRLHEALGYMDKYGDGYITKEQFLNAFERANVEVIVESLIYFFDMASEKFTPQDSEKVLSLLYFFKKILTENESKEYREITELFGKLADSLSYRGIDFDIVFADVIFSDIIISQIDHAESVTKHLEFIHLDEFISRLNMLNIGQLGKADIRKIGEYLSANDRKEISNVIFFGNYMHHMTWLPSSNKPEPASKAVIVAVICGKLIGNEDRFLKQCYEVADIINECITPSDLRSVLLANGIKMEFADTFIETITTGSFMDLSEVITKMKQEAILKYKIRRVDSAYADTMDIPHIDFQDVLKEILMDQKVNTKDLIMKCRSFDRLGNDQIMIFHLLNVLKHNLRDIEEIVLAGLYYELTLMRPDEYIDYKEFFVQYALVNKGTASSKAKAINEKYKKMYNELIRRIRTAAQKLNLMQLLGAFDGAKTGQITKEQLLKSLDWIEVALTKEEAECLLALVPKDPRTENVLWQEYEELVTNCMEVSPCYEEQQWKKAMNEVKLPEECKVIKELLPKLEQSINKQCPGKKLISEDVFINSLKGLGEELKEESIRALTSYGLIGTQQPDSKTKGRLINLTYFEQSFSMAFHKNDEEVKFISHRRNVSQVTEGDLKEKITSHFIQLGLGLQEYFDADFGEEAPKIEVWRVEKAKISEAINVLQIPLSLKEERLLLQLANLDADNTASVNDFCKKFDSPELVARRQEKVLDKLTTSILLKGYRLDEAFDILDKEKKDWVAVEELLKLFKSWRLGLTNFEIDDLITPITCKKENIDAIEKDQFIEQIAIKVLSLEEKLLPKAREIPLQRLNKNISLVLESSGMSLKDFFARFDYKKNGVIYVDTLRKILEELHMDNVSAKELEYILNAGDVDPKATEFELQTFCLNLENTLRSQQEKSKVIYLKVVKQLYDIIKARKYSIFDTYCQTNILRREGITRIQLVCILKSFGIDFDDIEVLWNTMQTESKIAYQEFLAMFVKAGYIEEFRAEPSSLLITSVIRESEESELIGLFVKLSQKRVDWEKAFHKEREDNTKRPAYQGLSRAAVSNCIRKLQLGLKIADIEKIVNALTFKSNTVTADEFVRQLGKWTSKELQQPTQSGKLRAYLEKLNNAIKTQNIDTAFAEVDKDKDGMIDVSEHNEFVVKLDMKLTKAEASNAFAGLTNHADKLSLYSLKKVLQSVNKEIETVSEDKTLTLNTHMEKNERQAIHQKIREQLLAKETNINNLFLKLKLDPLAIITVEGMHKLFEAMELVLSYKELNIFKTEVSEAFGKEEFTHQDLLDFIVRKRIDPNYGGVNQGIIICMNAISKELSKYGMTYMDAFVLFSKTKGAYVTMNDFTDGINGMQLAVSIEDVISVFYLS